MNIRLAVLVLSCAAATARATDVNVIGLFPNRAVVVIDRGTPKTLAVGQRTPEGVVLLSADSRSATFEIDGKRETLEMGRHFESAAQTGARSHVTLAPDSRGHYVSQGSINGASVRFLVDTGATMVSLPVSLAQRLGIDWRHGRKGYSRTANGVAVVYSVMLDSVSLGDITLYNVEGLVHEAAGLDTALLGMSFLARTDMKREGDNLTLVKRY